MFKKKTFAWILIPSIVMLTALISMPLTRNIVGPGNDPLATGYLMKNWDGPLPVDPPWYTIHSKTDKIGSDEGQLWHTTLYTFFGIPYKTYEYTGPGTEHEINPFF